MDKIALITLVFFIIIGFTGCSKMEEKKTTDQTKPPAPQTQITDKTESKDQTGNKVQSENKSQTENKSTDGSGESDEKAVEITKIADDAIAAYSSQKSEENVKEVIEKCMAAGNYLTFEASLPAREKYRPALKYYRKVLELDPGNEEAERNKKQIEDIYIQMGMPIPE